MVSIVIVEKTGVLKCVTMKTYDESELYKKAGLKTESGFVRHTTWKLGSNVNIQLFGKTTGRAGQENKYDFPPPVDSKLFFGSCILVNNSDGGDVLDLSIKQWEVVYEKLFGGFEDIGNEDSDDEDDEDEDDDAPRTKEGYVKDDFIVDDEDEEDEEEEEEEEEEADDDDDDEDEAPKRKKKPAAKRLVKNKRKNAVCANVFTSVESTAEGEYLDCTSELVEEDYV